MRTLYSVSFFDYAHITFSIFLLLCACIFILYHKLLHLSGLRKILVTVQDSSRLNCYRYLKVFFYHCLHNGILCIRVNKEPDTVYSTMSGSWFDKKKLFNILPNSLLRISRSIFPYKLLLYPFGTWLFDQIGSKDCHHKGCCPAQQKIFPHPHSISKYIRILISFPIRNSIFL